MEKSGKKKVKKGIKCRNCNIISIGCMIITRLFNLSCWMKISCCIEKWQFKSAHAVCSVQNLKQMDKNRFSPLFCFIWSHCIRNFYREENNRTTQRNILSYIHSNCHLHKSATKLMNFPIS